MNQSIYEYSVICPECKTKSVMVIEETDVTLFKCACCKQYIMLYKNSLHKIRGDFLEHILREHSTEECGYIVFTRRSSESEEYITKDKLKDLKATLKDTFYIEDFLKNL